MRCICCGFNVNPLHLEENEIEEDIVYKAEMKEFRGQKTEMNAGSEMWDDGIVNKLSAGYGSGWDGSFFIVAICDTCITKKLEGGDIAYVGDYMSNGPHIEVEVEKYRKIWRRSNSLDKLV